MAKIFRLKFRYFLMGFILKNLRKLGNICRLTPKYSMDNYFTFLIYSDYALFFVFLSFLGFKFVQIEVLFG